MRYIDENNNFVYTGTLDENKREAYYLISQDFLDLGKTNFIKYKNLEIDNRWVEKNDLQNYEMSYSLYKLEEPSYSKILLKDRNNLFHYITLNELEEIIQLCAKDRLKKLNKKWEIESRIAMADSIIDIWNIYDEFKTCY